ncbi:MAG: MarR family winged helix-turn-helix transcriptional regulator [Thermoplasmatota archaeon]
MSKSARIAKGPELIGKYMSVLLRTAHSMIARDLLEFGIGSGQHMFLLSLNRSDGVKLDTLTKRLMVDKATTTRAVSKLEKMGYVRREVDPSDKRAYLVYMTPEGRSVIPRVRQTLKEVMDMQTSDLSDQEKAELTRILLKMVESCRDEMKDHHDVSPSKGGDRS